MTVRHVLAALAATGLMVPPAAAQQMFFFPAQGQSQQQLDQDRGTCNAWATRQTGFDPMTAGAVPTYTAGGGGALRGGAMAAAGGAAIGAIAGNAGRGAAIGAVGGGLVGGARRRSNQNAADNANRNAQGQRNAQAAEWQRALRACMEGKGYSVS